MSAKTDNRRHRSLFAAITHDPYRKLASVALAIGLWYLLDTQITDSVVVSYRPVAVDPASAAAPTASSADELQVIVPSDQVTVRKFVNPADGTKVELIQIKFEGPKFLVQNLERLHPRFSAGPFDKVDFAHVTDVGFTAAELSTTDRAVTGVSIKMQPPSVRIELEQNRTIEVPAKLDKCELVLPPGDESLGDRLRKDNAQFSRPSVRISGPVSNIDQFTATGNKPFKVILAKDGRSLSGTLKLNVDGEALKMDELPRLTIELLPEFQEFPLELLVRVDDLSLPENLRGRYKPKETSKQVRVKAAGELLSQLTNYDDPQERANWARNNLRLSVWIQRGADDAAYPQELVLAARMEWLGVLASRVDPTQYGLAEQVTITLERRP